jgi:crossover junction endodeoxyribonuclease RuvC
VTYVVGLDLSLTSTGVAAVGETGYAFVVRVRSKAPTTVRHPRTGKPTQASLLQRHERLNSLAHRIVEAAAPAPLLVVVEQPAFSQTAGQQHDRSGLWWLVVRRFLSAEVPVVEVTPGQLKRYATGSGSAGKDEVLAAVVRRYGGVEVANNDEADALVLASMGARYLGFPIDEPLPKANASALDGVHWPE